MFDISAPRFRRWLEYAVLTGSLVSIGCGLAYPIVGVLLASDGGGGGGDPPSQSVTFTVETNIDLLTGVFIDPAGKTSGPPRIFIVLPTSYQVTFGLNNVPAGEDVPLVFDANTYLPLDADGGRLTISDVCFSPYPPSQIPPGPSPCPPVSGPRVHWRDDANYGAVLEVTNPNATAMNVLLEGATAEIALDPTDVYPGSPASGALAWSLLFSGTLGPQETTLVDVDDGVVDAGLLSATEIAAILLRYSSSTGGVEQAGMYHLEVDASPVSVERKTWGSIKALYR
ncbi:MAG: hypothetical protein L0Z51_08330 [Candidatus Latescibacteria bacterium]|nr:hypothetical protein [Candidatus Latescibacterota bacterium]